jgi:AraC-like DNA-binding protein
MLHQNERTLQNPLLPNGLPKKQYFETKKSENIDTEKKEGTEELETALSKVKTELANNKKNLLIEGIKKAVIDQIYYSEKQMKINFSDYLSQTLGYHYTYMANLFTKIHGTSVQTFIIETKIERVKELLVYEGMTLTEISFKLHYSSVAHLSNQFKKITGLSPSKYLASITKGDIAKTNKAAEAEYPTNITHLQENIENVSLQNLPKENNDNAFSQI